jgi:hypothetical protein
MVLNATFNNISAKSWQSVLLMEETRVPGEKHRPVVEDSDWIVLYIPDGKLHYCKTKIPFVLRGIGKEPSFSFSGVSPLKRVAIDGMNRLYVYQIPLHNVVHLSLSGIRTHNISGDRHRLHR